MHARSATAADGAEVVRLARLMFESMGVDASGAGWQRAGEQAVEQRLRQVMAALLGWYEAQGVPVVELHATALGEPLYRSLGFDDGSQPALRRTVRAAAS